MNRQLTIKTAFLIVIAAFLVLQGCNEKEEALVLEKPIQKENKKEDVNQESQPESQPPKTVFVFVCGSVVNPGVYELPTDSRVYEAIQMAGGITPEGDGLYVNQAESLLDGTKIYVPRIGEDTPLPEDEEVAAEESVTQKMNINTASKEELMTLTGIGEAKANAIIKYREDNGGFQTIEELTNIEGIKDGVFQKVKDDITV